MKRFVIVGLGNFGSTLAQTLADDGHDVIAIDREGAIVDRMAPRVSRAAVGDATDIKVLKNLGADQADVAVVSTGDDITASILATLALRDLKVREVYVKVVSIEHGRVMERIGVTAIVFPERDSAIGLAARISGIGLLNYVELGGGFSIQEMAVPSCWIGKTIRELNLRSQMAVSIVALHDILSGQITATPDPDGRLKESDTLLIAGHEATLEKVAKLK